MMPGLLMVLVAVFSFLMGATFVVYYSKHLIRSGKRVPRYLRDVGVQMPPREEG